MIHELNLKVNENLSYVNAKSQRTLLYNMDISIERMTFKRLELHAGEMMKCCEMKIINFIFHLL